MRRALGRLLRSLGLGARTFASGPESLADPRRDEASCWVIDVHMPEMSGYALSKQLARTRPDSSAILISARAEEANRWMIEAPGAVGLLIKPLTENQFVAALTKALGPGLFSEQRS